ncbi:MAG: hypothetical protein LBT53_00905 [Puniceicoccales bacterium]|jgi:hypothetical protein|nr:hypothetical protein [Puniceicoccales bacterium]
MATTHTSSEKPFQPVPPALRERADAGDAPAQFLTGECFSNGFAPFVCRSCGAAVSPESTGDSTCPDCGAVYPFAKAVKWYESAAKRNYAPAFVRLHVACFYGIGTTKNEKRAKLFFEKAKVVFPKLRHPPLPPFDLPSLAGSPENGGGVGAGGVGNGGAVLSGNAAANAPLGLAGTTAGAVAAGTGVTAAGVVSSQLTASLPFAEKKPFALRPLHWFLLAILWCVFFGLIVFAVTRSSGV